MKSKGDKHTGWRDVVEVARDVRRDIKAAQAEGKLPSNLKLTVRCHKFSMGQSLRVNVDLPLAMAYEERLACRALAERIAPLVSQYNERDIDSMSDYCHVMFYGTVTVNGMSVSC